ncbi:squalene--hopene cyclase [Bacillus shivajii]|uniref:squalene--hopene cyclase n=1 Tax=Bacillus shivajii TaxID=1983719 RepID=UPI001CF97E1A|nr:squalene--hopene cyclase [Bacillus shivajii]UCZ53552.1 squalene--hopene cyclase [Bacillus shivajii]
MEMNIHAAIDSIMHKLRTSQQADGSWQFCFESGPLTDAYMIILLRTLEDRDELLIQKLVERLLAHQDEDGTWKLFHDEKEGNLSATVEAYYALLYSGYVDPQADNMIQAKSFIIKQGGLHQVQYITKAMLAVTGQITWPKELRVPIEMILLPPSSPISFYDFVGYARVHFAPILITSNQRYQLKTEKTPNLDEIITRFSTLNNENNQEERVFSLIKKEIEKIKQFPQQVRQSAFKRAEQFMLERIERDGTLYSYAPATFFMIFALFSLGYNRSHPMIVRAVQGLKQFICHTNGQWHAQFTTSTVWDTALISHSLQKAGVPETAPMIIKAGEYLLSKQHYKFGDWALTNPFTMPGGWGFSHINTINPDVDDTSASLRAIHRIAARYGNYQNSFSRGASWLLTMQNNDGGWPAFERNLNKPFAALIPFKDAERVFLDPSTADLTGRALEFLGNGVHLSRIYPNIRKGVNWLMKHQEKNGSWYGRWGICYIYGTWAAITGLKAVGVHSNHSALKRGTGWLLSVQHDDGGWGESCYSDVYKKYVPLNASTPSQTAWALDALISFYDQPTDEMKRGINQLINLLATDSWQHRYPTGAGLPGDFYINYHSYRYIWPLLTLSHYRNKFM